MTDVSITLVPKDVDGVNVTSCKIVSLLSSPPSESSSSSHTMSSRTLPPHSQACFIISSEDLLPYFIDGNKAESTAGNGAELVACNDWANIVILYKVDDVAHQLGVKLSRQCWSDTQCTSLENLCTWINSANGKLLIFVSSSTIDRFILATANSLKFSPATCVGVWSLCQPHERQN